nr:hypothetical protein [Bradyrhizobium sp.]
RRRCPPLVMPAKAGIHDFFFASTKAIRGYTQCSPESVLCRPSTSKYYHRDTETQRHRDTEQKSQVSDLIFFYVSQCLCGDYLLQIVIEDTDPPERLVSRAGLAGGGAPNKGSY